MSETIVAKSGGTSNIPNTIELSVAAAEQADIFVASAPGNLPGVEDDYGNKVTDQLISLLANPKTSPEIIDSITNRYAEIIMKLGGKATLHTFLDKIPSRIDEAVRGGEGVTITLGEQLQAELYAEYAGFKLLDPSDAGQDLGTDRHAWHNWISSAYTPGQKYMLVGNKTIVNGQVTMLDRNGSDISPALAVSGANADIYKNYSDTAAKSANPNVVDPSKLLHIEHLLHEEGRELGSNGTGLLHPDAITYMMHADHRPIEIRNIGNIEGPYTLLDNDTERARERVGKAIAISLMNDVVIVRIHEYGMGSLDERLITYEKIMAENGIAIIDSDGHGRDRQNYYIKPDDAELALRELSSVIDGGTVELSSKMSMVTLVGYKIKQNFPENFYYLHSSAVEQHLDWNPLDYDVYDGSHAIRIGVEPIVAENVIRKVHASLIERRDTKTTNGDS